LTPLARPAQEGAAANGPIAAALLACGIGCFTLGVLAVAADGSNGLAALLNFYRPTGPLAGVTTVAIAVWLLCWAALARLWKASTLPLGKIGVAAFLLLGAGFLLTFPPIGDVFLGR
jgi:hypothetical protein